MSGNSLWMDGMPTSEVLYASPRVIHSPSECWFYHTIELPELGLIEGEWDLRAGVNDYLGGVPFAGKRVLELGCASGFLTFEMEKRGAEVIGFDLAPGLSPDLIPLASYSELGDLRTGLSHFMEQLRNSFWLGHRLTKSRARVIYGVLYQLPPAIDEVDISTFGSILLHLRDPFLALANAARFTKETMIVTDVFHRNEWDSRLLGDRFLPVPPVKPRGWRERLSEWLVPPAPVPDSPTVPALVFLPNPKDSTLRDRLNSWWQFTPAVIERMLGILGFGDATVTTHRQKFRKTEQVELFTVTARRTEAMPTRRDGPFPWY